MSELLQSRGRVPQGGRYQGMGCGPAVSSYMWCPCRPTRISLELGSTSQDEQLPAARPFLCAARTLAISDVDGTTTSIHLGLPECGNFEGNHAAVSVQSAHVVVTGTGNVFFEFEKVRDLASGMPAANRTFEVWIVQFWNMGAAGPLAGLIRTIRTHDLGTTRVPSSHPLVLSPSLGV
jgi:hypothetical protein